MIEGQETKVMSMRDAVILAMSEEMRRDENVFLMGEDVGIFGGDFGTSVGMLEEFGKERVRDTPISENAISGCAVGAALTGMRPIVDVTFMDFIVYMMDNIVNQAAKTRYMYGGKGSVPVVFRCAAGSGVGSAAQHSQSLEAWFCHIPGLKVVAPGTPADLKGLLKASIRDNNPVIFLEYKAEYNVKGEVPLDPEYVIPLGKAELKRMGKDVTVITYGRMLRRVLEAADTAREKGIEVEVVDLRTLMPLDKDTILESVKKTGRVLLVNDAHKTGGFIGEISAMIAESDAFDYLDGRILRLAADDIPVPYNHALEDAMLPKPERILKYIERLVEKR
ncbi:MAG: alpha-ketoacid dehydrogenase subunit beta [Porphyromonadaceae bacterium]|nr:alpha-ketoacid dehydrogenase subunit beta [Porphyromonadaceae bacterium]